MILPRLGSILEQLVEEVLGESAVCWSLANLAQVKGRQGPNSLVTHWDCVSCGWLCSHLLMVLAFSKTPGSSPARADSASAGWCWAISMLGKLWRGSGGAEKKS